MDIPYLSRPPPWGPLGIIFYYSEDLPVRKIIILRGGLVVGIISPEDLKKLVENSKRHWHPQSETHKKRGSKARHGKTLKTSKNIHMKQRG